MSIRKIVLLLLFANCSFAQDYSQHRTRPNIILVMIDDFGSDILRSTSVDSIGAWSVPIELPHMKSRFDGKVVEMTNFFASPICTPSRLQLLTGKTLNKVYVQHAIIQADELLLPNILRREGYSTALIGKEQFGLRETYRQFKAVAIPPEKDTLEKIQRDNMLGWSHSLPQWCYDDENNIYYHKETKYSPDRRYNNLISFIESKQSSSNPFFVNYMMLLTHAPFLPTPYDDEFGQYIDNAKYLASMAKYADFQINSLINYIENSKELKSGAGTILIIFGDNGTAFRRGVTLNNDITNVGGQKGRSNDLGTRVPAYIHCVGKNCKENRGSIIEQPIGLVDIFATVLDLAKEEERPHNDGISLAKYIVDYAPQIEDRKVLCQYFQCYWPNLSKIKKSTNFNTFCTDGTYWLDSYDRFYNVKKDPENKKPIIPSSTMQSAIYNQMKIEIKKLPDASLVSKKLYTYKKKL